MLLLVGDDWCRRRASHHRSISCSAVFDGAMQVYWPTAAINGRISAPASSRSLAPVEDSFSKVPALPIIPCMDGINLPPDLEQFAAEAVASGRFQNVSDVVRTAVELLRQREHSRAQLLTSVLAAQEQGDRLGYLTGDEVAAHVRQTIARKAGTAA